MCKNFLRPMFIALVAIILAANTWAQELPKSTETAKEISVREVSEAAGFLAAAEEHASKKIIDVAQFKIGFLDALKKLPDAKRTKQAQELVAKTWGTAAVQKNALAKPSYELGLFRAAYTKQQLKLLDPSVYLASFEKTFPLTVESPKAAAATITLANFIQQERMRGADLRLKEAQEFLAENAKRKNVIVTKSGLQYEILEQGDGKLVAPVDVVKVHYKHTNIKGEVIFDSEKENSPDNFAMRGDIPDGWHELFLKMNKGARYKVYLPPALGYGKEGSGDTVLPNQLLITEFKVLEIIPPPPVAF